MNIKKGTLIIFIISIIGLAIVQYQYLKIGLNLAKVQFDQKIGNSIGDIKESLQEKNELTFLAGKAMTADSSYFKLSLDSLQDASRFFMNDFLKEKLLQNGIKTDFTYIIYSRDSTDYLKSPQFFDNEVSLMKYPFNLEGYLPKLLDKSLILELRFKNINKYFLGQLNGLTIPSLIFIIAIIFVVLWVLKSFYWQRNLNNITNEFINNLTHELKTPVFSIGIATKILEEKGYAENTQILGIIRNQVDKLKGQIEKVLELASLEGKQNVLKKAKVDFKPVILKIINEFGQLAELENIDFKTKITGDQFNLYCEPNHLENAINTLLENAKKYSDKSSKISMTIFLYKKNLIIAIEDNGIGILDADQKKIFKKYYRASSGDLHNVKGYGLGLNYVQQVLKSHKAKISVKSKIGKGSIFTISIPLLNNNGK
jgi:two-component system phosphate regulon sensor histidine kinase PhoR